jgi:glycosyltransferase involved in cell wall biosynthesis
MPAISVVIPTRGRASTLPAVLSPLLADAGVTEIVVVVDGPDPDAARVLAAMAAREPRLRVEHGAGTGPGAARAVGVAAATSPLVLLLDDDVVAASGLGSAHAARHGDGEQRLVVGRLEHPHRDGPAEELYATAYDAWLATCRADPGHLLTNLWLGNASLPRATALAVSLDEPRMHGARHEDREFGLRLRSAGIAAVLDESLTGIHHHHRDVAGLAADARAEGAGLRTLHDLHGTPLPPPVPNVPGLGGLLRRGADRSETLARLLRRYEIARGARE